MSTETKNKKDVLNKEMKASKEPSLANAPTSKKIGFFSAMMIAFGSCVGAGIFFKYGTVNSDTNGSFVLAMFAWILAAFVVMSMVLALMEIASARNDNLSMIGWCKTFNSRIMYKACKNFMFYIYLPLTYFFMPLYVIQSLLDGVSAMTDISGFTDLGASWAIMMGITLIMSLYFIFACGFSSKWGDIQNKIITYIKFIPLVLAVVFGIWGAAVNGTNISAEFTDAGQTVTNGIAKGSISFATMTPGFGLFMAMGAIFFAYDGFYVAAGLQSEMKEPKKTPLALVLGLGLVTIVYLAIAIATSLGVDFGAFLSNKVEVNEAGLITQIWSNGTNVNLNILFGIFNILIGVGVLGIINGFALWAPRFTEDLIREGELPYSELAAKGMASKWGNRPWIGMLYNVIISIPVVILFCIIGGLGYINQYGPDYGDSIGRLLSFADLMGTWTAVFAFLFIIAAIFGGITNRRTNRVKTEKSKIFLPFAYISVIIGGLVIFITFLQPFFDLFLIFALDKSVMSSDIFENLYKTWLIENPNLEFTTDVGNELIAQSISDTNQQYNEIIIARVLLVVVFFLQVGIMLIPAIVEDQLGIKKYGSVEAADKAKIEKINAIFGKAGEKVVMSKDQIAVDDIHSTTFDQDNVEFKKEKVDVAA